MVLRIVEIVYTNTTKNFNIQSDTSYLIQTYFHQKTEKTHITSFQSNNEPTTQHLWNGQIYKLVKNFLMVSPDENELN